MKTIINNKKYDTELCEKIIGYNQKLIHNGGIGIWHPVTIYKTQKGAYLKYIGGCNIIDSFKYSKYESLDLLNKDEVKAVLIKSQKIDIYEKEFGKVECG